jgi:hypothetical protein
MSPRQLTLAALLVGTVLPHLSSAQNVDIEVEAPSGLVFDVDPNVPSEQLALIKTGLGIGQRYMDDFLGGGIPAAIQRQITVKVVATGLGDAFGNCCGSSHEGVARPFFDVAHPGWTRNSDALRLWGVVHEYTHVWQFVDCRAFFGDQKIFWLTEGIANFVGYQTLIHNGLDERRSVLERELSTASASGQLAVPLEHLADPHSPTWPGNVGHIAVDRLVVLAPQGQIAVSKICDLVASGNTVAGAFHTAFGISLGDFYDTFNAHDADSDGIHLPQDNCPAIGNPNQTNSDMDREGNACDVDDDNDGLSDDEELTLQRNPLVNEPAVGTIINSILFQ